MDNIAQLGIKVDSTDIKKATTELNNLSTASGKTEKTTNSLVGGFSKIQAGAIAAAAGITAMAKAGIDYNAQMEKLTNGLTTLNVLTSKNVDSNGKALSQEQKYNLARLESIETMKKLNAVNLETPHTLDQTVQIYKSMYTSMKTAGVSSEEMIDLTKKLSIAAGSSGIEFQQLLSGIDGLATGTVEASSELGRFLKSMGLGNEVLKNSTNIYETLNNKFKDVKGIMGYDEAVSNLTNSFDQLTGSLVAPFFDDVKDGITGLSGMFNELTNSVTLFYDKFKSISELTSREQLNKRAVEVSERIQQIQEDLKDPSWFQSSGKLNAELRAANLELLAINQSFIDMDKSSASTLVATDKIVETKEETKKLTSTVKDNSKAIQDNSLYLEALSSAYTEMAQSGLSDYDNALISIAEKTQKWIEAGVNVNDVLTTQKQLLEDLNVQQSLSSASDELSFLERKAQLMTDEYEKSKLLLEIKYAQSMIDIQSSDSPLEQKQMMIDKETELYNLTKERIELDRNTEFQETIKTFQEEALERQQELNAAIYDFGDSFEGAGNKISKVAKSLAAMANSEIKSKKEREKLDRKYTKQFNEYAGDVEKTKELEQEYSKETAQINDQSISNQIDGYSNLAGAISGLYEEGSAKAEKWLEVQKILSVVSGVVAIASAMANGDGYTAVARGLAVAATLVSFGWKGSGGAGESSSGGKKKPDQFEIKEQQIEEMYTPMTDRLDRQIELLESIDKQGSASASSLQGAGITFKRDYELAVNDILKTLPNDVRGYGLDFNQQLAGAESRLGFNIADVNRIKKSGWDKSEKRIYTDFSSLSKDFNLLKVISDYFSTGDGAISAWFGGASKINIAANEIQTAIGDFTMGIVSSLDDMKTASNDFKSIYDEITGSMYYENKRLAQAYTDVEKLTKGTSLAEYLKNNIDQIDFLQQTFNSAVLETLLSQDPKDMAEQIKVLEKLQSETGLVFENGARDALDFMESIKLVGESMANTVESRKALTERLQDTKILDDSQMLLLSRQRELSTYTDLTSISILKQIYAQEDLNTKISNRTSLIDSLKDFVSSINSSLIKTTTFKDFSTSFNEMIEAIKIGSDDLTSIGSDTIASAQSYLDTVARTAKSSAEIEFAKKVISNKFEGVINAKDITLGTINDTLKISFNEDSVIVKALNDVKNELVYLNQLNTRQTANSNKTLQLQRASIA